MHACKPWIRIDARCRGTPLLLARRFWLLETGHMLKLAEGLTPLASDELQTVATLEPAFSSLVLGGFKSSQLPILFQMPGLKPLQH